MITQDRLKEVLFYDQKAGVFTRKIHLNSKMKIGDVAGSLCNGYREIRIDGERYKEHRLAWLYVHGVFPENFLDHIDHNKQNNKIVNLREVTKSENMQNQISATKRNMSSRLLGVTFDKNERKFKAQIRINGKQTTIGRFKTEREAHAAYVESKRIHHATCTL